LLNAAGGIVWAGVFGLGGYLLGEGVHRIAAPIGWAALASALVAGLGLWRFFKSASF
jgi:membrane protein DedA with SNARE-associated domain